MASEGSNLVGVDIGSSSIKVCEIKERRSGRHLVRMGYHPLPPQTIVDGHIMNRGAILEGLERLFHKSRRRKVAIWASGHSVIIKKISLPLMSDAELAEHIQWEAEQHIPFDLSEVFVDHQVLLRRPEQGQMDVLLVAAKREDINDLNELAIEAKLRPVVVDLDAFAVQNLYEAGYGAPPVEETVVLIHSGASLTTVNILAEGTTAFTRTIAHGGAAVTEEIQRALGIGYEEAEAYKLGGDGRGLVPKEVPEIVEAAVEQLAGEVQRSLDFFLATSSGRDITRVYVSGGNAQTQAFVDAIARRAGGLVERFDSLRAAPPDTRKVDHQQVTSRAPQLAVAMGLALRKERERR